MQLIMAQAAGEVVCRPLGEYIMELTRSPALIDIP